MNNTIISSFPPDFISALSTVKVDVRYNRNYDMCYDKLFPLSYSEYNYLNNSDTWGTAEIVGEHWDYWMQKMNLSDYYRDPTSHNYSNKCYIHYSIVNKSAVVIWTRTQNAYWGESYMFGLHNLGQAGSASRTGKYFLSPACVLTSN